MRITEVRCDRCSAPIALDGSIVSIENVAGAIRLKLPSQPVDLCEKCGESLLSWLRAPKPAAPAATLELKR